MEVAKSMSHTASNASILKPKRKKNRVKNMEGPGTAGTLIHLGLEYI